MTIWADEHYDACPEVVDPTVRVVDDDIEQRWALPAGWVEIVNALHVDLIPLLATYEVERVTNKMSALRYAIRWRLDLDPKVRAEVEGHLAAARRGSLSTCDLCGAPATGTLSFGVTRCANHPATGPCRVLGATARPPGCSPREMKVR